MPQYEPHPLVSLVTACFSVILWFLAWVKTAVAFVTITLPVWIYAVLSYSLTLRLDFVTLIGLFVFTVISGSYYVRFQFLSNYEELKELPIGKPDVAELHPDAQGSDDAPASFHGYLDEFLSAVKIFGFLEKPVFHELARHLQTRRLIAGDSLALDQDQNFYCVVEGLVQVYAPSGKQTEGQEDDAWAEEEMNGYQLLNEVGSGGTLSSLFTILSQFTENVKLSWQDDEDSSTSGEQSRADSRMDTTGRPPTRIRSNSEISQLDLLQSPPSHATPSTRAYSPGSPLTFSPSSRRAVDISTPMMGAYTETPRAMSGSQTTTPGADYTSFIRPTPLRRENTITASQVRRGMVARATQDSTLAVIPAEAFRRLTKKFPKASAHMVQVILTRFSRVTFNAAHKYLGLTTELLRTEKAINELARHPLPPAFYEGGGMQALRNKFTREVPETLDTATEDDTLTGTSTVGLDSEDDYFGFESSRDSFEAITPSSKIRRRSLSRDSSFSDYPVTSFSDFKASKKAFSSRGPSSSNTRLLSHSAVTAGDLHTSASSVYDNYTDTYRPRSRGYSVATPGIPSSSVELPSPVRKAVRIRQPTSDSLSPPPSVEIQPSGDINLRDEVMSSIAKSIGLIQPPLSETPSAGTSPVMIPFDGRSGSSVPSRGGIVRNSFASLSFLDVGGDDGSSSMTGASSMNPSHPWGTGLDNEVEILCFTAGSVLVRAGERRAGIFYVIDGFLDVSIPIGDSSSSKPKRPDSPTVPTKTGSNASIASRHQRQSSINRSLRLDVSGNPAGRAGSTTSTKPATQASASKHLFTVKPGGIAGYLASLSGTPSYVEITAKVDTYVCFLPHEAIERLIERRPIVLLTLSKRLISLLSPLVLHIDSSLDWMQVHAGQVLWRPGDASDSFYIVLNGRLRSLADKDGAISGEYGQGDTVGELDVITRSPRTTTLHAIRDSELARMPQTLFNAISIRHPQAAIQLLQMIASRVRASANPSSSKPHSTLSGRSNLNLKTVAILPAARNVPVAAFAKKLHTALEEIGASTSYLNQAVMMSRVGRHAFTRMGKLKVAGWLAEEEQKSRIVLYVADSPVSAPWTQTCIRQADYIMIVGMGDDPTVGEYERLLLTTKTTARKELVLLHPDRSVPRGSTREWLKIRSWVHAYHHVELPGLAPHPVVTTAPDPAAVKAFKDIKNRFDIEYRKIRGYQSTPQSRRPDHIGDFNRLARRVCGRSIGLVLGGGGARGMAHLGILKAFEEQGIPIDHIGGTSMGAFIGGLYAREGNMITSVARAKTFSGRMGNIWRMLSDVTWPVVAYTTGHEFNRSIFKSFGALHIEDMWIPYFCNTTNILTSRMEVHDTGYAWRYIRASMTLVGLLPPLCDNGNMLVDGGYLDNLPVSTMMNMGPRTIFAVDVGSLDDNSPRNFGDTVSGWWILLNRWNPFSAVRNIPPITEIQSRLAYVSSIASLEEAKSTEGCYYIQPPVQGYGTMQFAKFEELVDIGYEAGLEILKCLQEEGKELMGMESEQQKVKRTKKSKGRSLRRNSV